MTYIVHCKKNFLTWPWPRNFLGSSQMISQRVSSDVVTLNCCLLPTRLRWIFRPHRFLEGLASAAERIAAALISHHCDEPFATVHLQEVFEKDAYAILERRMYSVGLVNASGFSSSGLCSFSILPLEPLFERRIHSRGSARPKAWQALAIGGSDDISGQQVHVNLHLASEIDGSHTSRLEQALQRNRSIVDAENLAPCRQAILMIIGLPSIAIDVLFSSSLGSDRRPLSCAGGGYWLLGR